MNYLFPLMAVLIWSFNTVVSKQAASSIHPAEIGFLRWLLAAALLSPFLLPGVVRNWRAIRPQVPRILTLGLLGMVIYQTLAYFAAGFTTATHMGIILCLSPLIVLAISVGVLGHPLTRGGAIGSVIALTGVIYVVTNGQPLILLEQGFNQGDLLMIIAAVSYALYNILLKRWNMAPKIPTLQLLYLQMLVAVIAQLPIYLMSEKTGINARNWGLVAYAGTMASIAAPLLWMMAVSRLGPSRSSIFFNLTPICTALFASLLLNEQLHAYHWIGGVLTIAGVVLAEKWITPLAPAARTQQRSKSRVSTRC
ncbi:DMT family transporter [Diaphorobacter sp. HDW4A]|uniref:DMT family transporter n=1 Tax=Diaphorobacter sp. HDW4A TaxID=2714924 RepID=UPI001409EBE9|nr:DMT family transporter [Diaphorobacter sp. HDW4A]QIL83314.1 DMT family transporter [Diaphorobacter sp. HDW4A]